MVAFAKPIHHLAGTDDSKIQPSRLTPDVAGGHGFTLDEKGKAPSVVEAGAWSWEYVTSTINPANLAAHTGQAHTVTVTGLRVGDLCFWIGADSVTAVTQNHWFTRPPLCSTEEQITLAQYNADTAAADVASGDHYFLVIHRFL